MSGESKEGKWIKWIGWGLAGLVLISIIYIYSHESMQVSYRTINNSPPPPPRIFGDNPAIAMQSIGYVCYYKNWDKITGNGDAFNFDRFPRVANEKWCYSISWERKSGSGLFEFTHRMIVGGTNNNIRIYNDQVLKNMEKIGFLDNAEFKATIEVNYGLRTLRVTSLALFKPLISPKTVTLGGKEYFRGQVLPKQENLRKMIPYISSGSINPEVPGNWNEYTINN